MAEAVRQYAASVEATPQASPWVPGLGASRTLQLLRDLALTPEQRVRLADDTLRSTVDNAAEVRHESRSFERYEDFLDWKRDRTFSS